MLRRPQLFSCLRLPAASIWPGASCASPSRAGASNCGSSIRTNSYSRGAAKTARDYSGGVRKGWVSAGRTPRSHRSVEWKLPASGVSWEAGWGRAGGGRLDRDVELAVESELGEESVQACCGVAALAS